MKISLSHYFSKILYSSGNIKSSIVTVNTYYTLSLYPSNNATVASNFCPNMKKITCWVIKWKDIFRIVTPK